MRSRTIRYITLIFVDAVLINLSVYLTLLLRFDASIPAEYIRHLVLLGPLVTVVTITFMFGLKLYDRIWGTPA
jgi:FlaA1/EpsC-like NDP-sugar epimerase